MAANSARSTSPLISRPCNQSTRASENNLASRGSCIGSGSNNAFSRPPVLNSSRRVDPNTPANSPADFRRRSTTDACLKNFEEKENNDEKDSILRVQKMNSPSKNCKNFMAPTISATFKFSPSPRKKVLTERNDPLRTSISLSDGKAIFLSSNVSHDLEPKSENALVSDAAVSEENKVACEGPAVCSKPLKKVTFALSDSHNRDESSSGLVTTESGSLKLQSSLKDKLSCSSPSNCIAPLDADPSMPPYDPKTNYLSPRPKYLHYKPNPRIELFLNREKELEDSLMAEIMSETISDSDDTEVSQEGGDSAEGESEPVVPYDMVIGLNETEVSSHAWGHENADMVESKDSISADKVTVVEGKEVDPQAYECVPTIVTDALSDMNSENKNEKKSWAFSRLMRFTLLLTFLISCASICYLAHSPSFGKLVLTDLSLSDVSSFYQQSRLAASAKANFGRLAIHANHLSADLVSVISKLGRGGELVQLQFMNLSDLQKEDTWQDGYFLKDELKENMGGINHSEPVEDLEVDELEEEVEEEAYEEADSEDNIDTNFDQQEFLLETEVYEENVEVTNHSEPVEDLEVDELEEVNTEAESDEEDDSEDNFATNFGQQEFLLETEVYEELEKNTEAEVDAFQIEKEAYREAVKEFDQQESVLETEVLLTPDPVLLPELESVLETEAAIHDHVLLPESELVLGTDVAVRDPAVLPESEHLSTTCQDNKLEAAAVQDAPEAEGKTKVSSVDNNSLTPVVPADIAFPIEVAESTPLQDNIHSSHHAFGLSSLLIAAMTVAFLVYKSRRNTPNSAGPAVKENECSGFNGNTNIAKETPPFPQNPQTGYDDDLSESCPSEMSSFQNDFREVSEVESIERRRSTKFSKRDSLAASSSGFSTGCASYGSFTTFERIPIKKTGNVEEEIVTPVRRSSRIRKHNITPDWGDR